MAHDHHQNTRHGTDDRPDDDPDNNTEDNTVDAGPQSGGGELLTPHQAAARLGLPLAQLARMRRRGTGPDWALLVRQTVRYSRTDLETWATHQQPQAGPDPALDPDFDPEGNPS